MAASLEYVRSRGEAAHGKKYDYLELRRLPNGVLQVLLKCPEKSHDSFWQATNNHYSGKGCALCNRAGKPTQHDLESVRAKFESLSAERYEYISIDRDSKYPKLNLVCSVHGKFSQNLYNHLAGKGCRLCKQGQTNRVSDEVLASAALKRNAAMLGSYQKYSSRNRILRLSCNEHGPYEQQMTAFLGGAECPSCAAVSAGKTRMNSLEDLQKYLTDQSTKIVDQDIENNSVLLNCEKHGLRIGNRKSIFAGIGCTSCTSGGSREADEMYLELLKFGLKVDREYTIPNSRLRLDFYFPSKGIAVEYHGLYWHSEEKVGRNYHSDKHKLAAKSGIRIIHIFSDEWLNRKSSVLSLIRNSLGLSNVSVFARKLTVIDVTHERARKFFDEHHIQGCTSASRYIGLEQGGTLLACTAYSVRNTDRTVSDGTSCEITRFASSVRVVGGFGKLLKALRVRHPEFKTLVTFSDTRVFSGKLYSKLGFKLSKELPPDYCYVVEGLRVHKSGFSKAKFKSSERFKFVEGLTEAQLAELNNLPKVWDCGKLRWQLDL